MALMVNEQQRNDSEVQKIISKLHKLKIVSESEKIEFLIGSTVLWGLNPCLIGTDLEIIHFDNTKGLLAAKKVYPFNSITGYTIDSKILSKIYLYIGGAQKVLLDFVFNPVTSQAFIDYLSRKINSTKETSVPLNISNSDEIAKFYELLTQGIITQEEFEQKKRQLLGL